MRHRWSMILARPVLESLGPCHLVRRAGAGRTDFAKFAKSAGQPQIPGLRIVYLTPLGDPAQAPWKNIILHQTEGAPGSARAMAKARRSNPKARRDAVGRNRRHGLLVGAGDRRHHPWRRRQPQRQQVHRQFQDLPPGDRINSIGVEFNGNAPDVRAPPTPEQFAAGLLLVRFLQERYGIPAERIYAHNWIDYKDARYCEGCELAERARAQAYRPVAAAKLRKPTGRSDVGSPPLRGR